MDDLNILHVGALHTISLVLYTLGRDGIRTWRRRRADKAQMAKYKNGSVLDPIEWRGRFEHRVTMLENRLDAHSDLLGQLQQEQDGPREHSEQN